MHKPKLQLSASVTASSFKQWHIFLLLLILLGVMFSFYLFWRAPETPFIQAVTLIKAGKAAAALPILEELWRQNPDDSNVYPWLAHGYLTTDRIAEGRTALDTALRLKLSPVDLVPTVFLYANYYESKGDFEEAERLYQSASTACPGKELNNGRAQLYLRWAEADNLRALPQQAVVHLELAAKYVADLNEQLKLQITRKLGQCYRQLAALAETKNKNDQEAMHLLEKSLSTNDEPATRMALAAIYARHKQYTQAIDNYSTVARADANNLEVRHHLVDLLVETKDYPKAQEALIDLTEKEKSVENYQLLASVDLKLNNYAGAVRALEDAIELRPKLELYKQLEAVLLDWNVLLNRQHKIQEAISVKGHAERVAEQISELVKDMEKKDNDVAAKSSDWDPTVPPVTLSFSRNWLAKSSFTPEGEINIKNISGHPVTDLTLTAVFYDNTAKRANGSVSLPVATPNSLPFPEGATRSLYFSCPTIVKPDHQLAVIILWKGRFLKEFPVTKQH